MWQKDVGESSNLGGSVSKVQRCGKEVPSKKLNELSVESANNANRSPALGG